MSIENSLSHFCESLLKNPLCVIWSIVHHRHTCMLYFYQESALLFLLFLFLLTKWIDLWLFFRSKLQKKVCFKYHFYYGSPIGNTMNKQIQIFNSYIFGNKMGFHTIWYLKQTYPLLISTDFLKYPFWHLFQTGIKFQL